MVVLPQLMLCLIHPQWVGMQRLLADMGLSSDGVMAVGDGGNDYELVLNCGLGVAMANAVPKVRIQYMRANDQCHIATSPHEDHLSRACKITMSKGSSLAVDARRCWTSQTTLQRPMTKMASRRHWSSSCSNMRPGRAWPTRQSVTTV